MADRARIDAFMAETAEFALISTPGAMFAPQAFDSDIARAVRTAERRLDVIADPIDPRMALVLMHIEEAEYAADAARAEEKLRSVEEALKSKGIYGSLPPDSIHRTHKPDCIYTTRFQFLGWGVLMGAKLVVMGKHMTLEDEDFTILGRETQLLALNTAQGTKPLEDKAPPNTIGKFKQYLNYLPRV